MNIRSRARGALAVAGALLLAACDDTTLRWTEVVDFKACQVTDTGGIDDKSYNQTAWNGMLRARDELGVQIAYRESLSEADYEPNIAAFIEEDCDLIVTVGFLIGDATEAAAITNPDRNFAIVDYTYEFEYPNLLGIVFATDQAAFLAGYVAAGTTQTGKVGTWGGVAIPPVTAFMDGYLAGARYYNQQNVTNVEVLGWDGTDGVFIDSFEDQDAGDASTAQLLAAGVDIVMPVAGPAGLGAAAAIEDFGAGKIIWVDTDGFFSTAFGSLMLTSVEKKIDNAIFATVRSALAGNFIPGVYLGDLQNEGVGIAPFHELEPEVPAAVKAVLPDLIEGLIDGSISTNPADYG